MRNPDRLDDFYTEFCKIHKKAFPDWRVGQLYLNFLGWVQSKNRDPFFPEEDELLKLFKEYANTNSPWYREN